jgi:hypothetical protein
MKQFHQDINEPLNLMPNTIVTPQTIYRVQVAVPVYLNDCFDYQVSAEQYHKLKSVHVLLCLSDDKILLGSL